MSRPFVMYHRDLARQGRKYDHDHHDKAELERDGWVDSVEKMGKLEWTVNNPAPHDLEPNYDDYDNEEDYLHDWYDWFTKKKGIKRVLDLIIQYVPVALVLIGALWLYYHAST